jgi:PRTRC genetic system protein E
MFFTQINQLMNQGTDITLVIRKKEGQLMVSTLPKSNGLKDEAQNHIVPLTITGTPEELDAGYLPAICQPIQKATGLLTNMSRFEEQAEKAAANSKAAKELKDKEAKEAKEKKEKFDKLMKKATDLESEQKLTEALNTLQQARAVATPQAIKSVDEKITAIKFNMRQGSLFEMEPVPAPQQPEPAVPVAQVQQPIPVAQPVMQPVQQPNQPPVYQQPVNANIVANGNGQVMFQPQQEMPIVQVNGNFPPENGGGQLFTQAPVQAANQNGQASMAFIPDPEPPVVMTVDYSAHREGEYDQYPDFPGYPENNTMYNHQNI